MSKLKFAKPKKPQLHVVSLSGGKDSTAMLLRMIEEGMRIDLIMFCDTGLEFPALYRHLDKLQKEIGNYKEVYFRAMRAKQREEERKKRWENTKILAVGIGVIFLIVFACMFLCRLIFG